jgi:hypothetical protein
MHSSTKSSRRPRDLSTSLVQDKFQPSTENDGDVGTTRYCEVFTRGYGGVQTGTGGDTHPQHLHDEQWGAITPCTREVVGFPLWAVQPAAVAEGWHS